MRPFHGVRPGIEGSLSAVFLAEVPVRFTRRSFFAQAGHRDIADWARPNDRYLFQVSSVGRGLRIANWESRDQDGANRF